MTSPSTQAQELFAEHIRKLEIGEDSRLESIWKETPELEQELRQLEAEWSRMRLVLSRLASTEEPLSERIRAEYGDSVDPEISLSQSSDGHELDESSANLMGKLTSQGGSDRYQAKQEIARGGMGAILRVWDEDLRRPLAMKVVLREDGGTSGAATDSNSKKRLSRFLEEAQITSQLDHPGIVPVHDLGIDGDGRVYFTMQLVDGRDVREVFALAEKGEEGWDQRRVVGVLIRVCEALAYAHSKGVVHRDIKPGNVMVGKFGEVFLMDWGLAKVMGRKEEVDAPVSSIIHTLRSEGASAEQTLAGDIVGTPAFMAPEQALGRGEDVGPASDLYAVGAMLYYMLAGQLPYQPLGESAGPLSILEAVKNGPPWAIHALRPEAPAELVAICEKAMAREVPDRFVDAMTLAGELRNWLEGNAVATYETGAFYSIRKWIGRNKGMAGALSGIVALLLASLGVFFQQQQQSISDLQDEQVLTKAAQSEADENLANMQKEAERANKERERAEAREREAFEGKVLVQSMADSQRVLAERGRGAGYRAQIIAAWFSLRLHEAAQTRQRLGEADPDLRGWEWGYLNLNSDSAALQPFSHETGSYHLLAFGDSVASMGLDGSLRVFDTEKWSYSDHATGSGLTEIGLFLGSNSLASKKLGGVPCAVSSDGDIVTAGYSSVIRLWDSESFEVMKSFRVVDDSDSIVSLAISTDGLFIASGDQGGTVRVWNVERELVVLEREAGPGLSCLALNPVSRQVAFGGVDGEVEVWAFSEEPDDDENSLTARIVERAADSFYEAFGMPRLNQLGRLDAFAGRVNAISFSADGLVLATAREDGEVHLWGPAAVDSEEGFRQGYVLTSRLRGHSLGVTCLCFSWDNLFIYAGGRDGTLRSWSVSDGSEVRVFEGHSSEVRGVTVLPDERIVSGALGGEVRVFDPYWQAARRVISEPGGGSALFVAEDPGGIEAIAVTNAGAVLREYPDSWLPANLGDPSKEQVWGAGTLHGERIALAGADRVIRLFDTGTGEVSRELEGHDGEVLALASDQDGDYLLSGARDRLAILWSELDRGEPELWEMEHERAVTSVSLSQDATTCVTADSGNTLGLWDVATQSKRMEWRVPGLGRLQGLAVSGDGALVATGLKLSALVYKASGKVEDPPADFGPHDSDVRSLVFSPDGRRLVTGDATGKIYVWDVGGEESLIELDGHASEIASLSFADEGRTLLSADASGEVLAWRSNFDEGRYKRWRKVDRVSLRAKRIVEFFGGDAREAAERLSSGYPGLAVSGPVADLIRQEALRRTAQEESESPVDDS